MVSDLLQVFFLLVFIVAVLAAGVLTAVWLWKKNNLPEGAPPPKWGDLSPLRKSAAFGLVARLATIGFLTLLMIVPISMISDQVFQRYYTYQEAVEEITRSWGESQTICGPVLVVPYSTRELATYQEPLTPEELEAEKIRNSGRTHKTLTKYEVNHHRAVILPEELDIKGQVTTEERKRSIYAARVYTADLNLSGFFAKPDIKSLREHVDEIYWDKASFVVGMSSTSSIKNISRLNFDGGEHKFLPGTNGLEALPIGFYSHVDLSQDKNFNFAFTLPAGGANNLLFTPVGVKNHFEVKSNWPHPNFIGSGLPNSRGINAQGFTAVWDLSNLVRNYPQFMDARGHKPNFSEYTTGVNFFEPVFHYSLLIRAVKYAILFIALTFLAVLFYELYRGKTNGQRLHLVQYGIIGLGLSLFYLVLLAASEHMPFITAYILASVLNILMISGYVLASLKRISAALVVGLIQLILYTALYFILRLEDYALAAGTALLVLAMTALMAATKNLTRPNVPH